VRSKALNHTQLALQHCFHNLRLQSCAIKQTTVYSMRAERGLSRILHCLQWYNKLVEAQWLKKFCKLLLVPCCLIVFFRTYHQMLRVGRFQQVYVRPTQKKKKKKIYFTKPIQHNAWQQCITIWQATRGGISPSSSVIVTRRNTIICEICSIWNMSYFLGLVIEWRRLFLFYVQNLYVLL